VKTVLDAFGVSYFESPCEADHLCAYLTTKVEHDKQIYCVSDDMDMFIYGSRYIIRNINISNKTLWYYDRNKVLDELELTSKELQEILILSGTDYNLDTNTSLSETIKWFQSYKKIIKKENAGISFYDWLVENTKYIKEYDKLITVYNYFTIDYLKIFENYNVELIQKKEKDENKIKEIMIEEGFIFLK
jgi:5'-3' exonuclease